MDKKISIIVPVYNNRKYLQECVDSIENQEYRNIECLLVDDGSDTDFVGYYDTFKSDRTTVYHINKSGVSGARNYGLAKATGDYVCFVDSDDIISPRYCSKLIDMIGNSGKRVATCAYARFRTSPLNKLSGGGVQVFNNQ